jgi:CubicO group peptidase (beta-lactamase class C family)
MPRSIVFSVLVSGGATSSLEGLLHANVQPILESLALKYNTSFAFGFHNADARVALAAGIDDHGRNTKVNTDSLYPSGSVTKSWTALGVLQLVQAGEVKLSDSVADLVNPFVSNGKGTNLEEMWDGDTTINKVTVEQLLRMRAGLNDYDNNKLEMFTFAHPNDDVDPYEMLENVNKTFLCEPGTCGAYSSINYELLGLLLAAKSPSSATWDAYDQMSVLPKRLQAEFNRTLFPLLGQCSKYGSKGMVHQYAVDGSRYYQGEISWVDIMPFSCLNGWTCGNIAAAPVDLASFYFHLLNGEDELVNSSLVAEMVNFEPLTTGWSAGLLYGLGLMSWSGKYGFKTVDASKSYMADVVGHGGEDWGSNAVLAGFNKHFGFGISFSTNSATGMNCSLSDVTENFHANSVATCALYNAALQAVGQAEGREVPELDCGSSQQRLRNIQRTESPATLSCAHSVVGSTNSIIV